MEYVQENFTAVYKEARPLLEEHWEAIGSGRSGTDMDPDWDKYFAMNDAGMIYLTTAREDGSLMGYALYLISTSLHQITHEFAELDVMWLTPSKRKGMTGIRMLKQAEEGLRKLGVHRIFGASQLHADIGRVYEHLGYRAVERIYAKDL